MEKNLVALLTDQFSDKVVTRLTGHLGEERSAVEKGIQALIPTVWAALIHRSSVDRESGIFSLADASRSALGDPDHLPEHMEMVLSDPNDPNGINLLDRAGGILKTLWGERLNPVAEALAAYAGLKTSSGHQLLALGAPAALSLVGQVAQRNGLNEQGAAELLQNRKPEVIAAVPAGYNLAGALGIDNLDDIDLQARKPYETYPGLPPVVAERRRSRVWVWLIVLVIALVAIWYFWKGCGATDREVAPDTDLQVSAMAAETTETAVNSGPELIQVTLPNGEILTGRSGGIEDRLVAFLNSDYQALPEDSLKQTWFDFDALTFETDQATITTESQAQIDNIAAILKAFPDAKLKIGGYTDKTGSEAHNKALSEERAEAVESALKEAGVAEQLVDAEGYGSAFAEYPADAPESDRAKDRHISVSIRK